MKAYYTHAFGQGHTDPCRPTRSGTHSSLQTSAHYYFLQHEGLLHSCLLGQGPYADHTPGQGPYAGQCIYHLLGQRHTVSTQASAPPTRSGHTVLHRPVHLPLGQRRTVSCRPVLPPHLPQPRSRTHSPYADQCSASTFLARDTQSLAGQCNPSHQPVRNLSSVRSLN